jgi:hypothetical protein
MWESKKNMPFWKLDLFSFSGGEILTQVDAIKTTILKMWSADWCFSDMQSPEPM